MLNCLRRRRDWSARGHRSAIIPTIPYRHNPPCTQPRRRPTRGGSERHLTSAASACRPSAVCLTLTEVTAAAWHPDTPLRPFTRPPDPSDRRPPAVDGRRPAVGSRRSSVGGRSSRLGGFPAPCSIRARSAIAPRSGPEWSDAGQHAGGHPGLRGAAGEEPG